MRRKGLKYDLLFISRLDKSKKGLYNFVIKLTVRKENIENGRKR